MLTKVYVAGSSKELARAQAFMQKLDDNDIHVTSTWPKVIGKVGSANLADATLEQLTKWTLRDFAEIDDADILALLLPALDAPTVGAWIELGYAFARDKLIVGAGPHRRIFTPPMIPVVYETDDQLAALIIERHRIMTKRCVAKHLNLEIEEPTPGVELRRADALRI